MVRNKLEQYLFKPSSSSARESIINNKLIFDLKLAAAHANYFLNIYVPEVDKDGFDVIFDDQESLAKIQLKTVMRQAGTSKWSFHKRLLRPTPFRCEKLGFEFSPHGVGDEGGIILIEIDASDKFKVRYFYTDITIICGIRDSLFKLLRPPRNEVITNFFSDISMGSGRERICLSKSLFFEVANPSALLSFMGLRNDYYSRMWRFHVTKLIEPREPDSELAAPYEILKRLQNNDISLMSPRVKKA